MTDRTTCPSCGLLDGHKMSCESMASPPSYRYRDGIKYLSRAEKREILMDLLRGLAIVDENDNVVGRLPLITVEEAMKILKESEHGSSEQE